MKHIPNSLTGIAIPAILCLLLCTSNAVPAALPERAPIPQWREDALRQKTRTNAVPAQDAIPAAERTCRKELRALGVAFAPAPAVKTKGRCSLPYPIEATTLSPTIRLKPAATLNCQTARAAARLLQTAGAAAAKKHLDANITTVVQGSAYVCRPINGTAKLSEHAFGNALDIIGFVLSDGRDVSVKAHGGNESAEAKFLKEFRAAACGPFTTVLGPGTDADHADHFHLDMKARRNRYCR